MALEDMFNTPKQLKGWMAEGGDPCEQSWFGVECSGSSVASVINMIGGTSVVAKALGLALVITWMTFIFATVVTRKFGLPKFGPVRLSRLLLLGVRFRVARRRQRVDIESQRAIPTVVEPAPTAVEPSAEAEHPRDPKNCVGLYITVAKGFILQNDLGKAQRLFSKGGGDGHRVGIHGVRPLQERPRSQNFKIPEAVRALEDDIHQEWFSINDTSFDSSESLHLVQEQYQKHGWKIARFPSMLEYVQFALREFRKLNLDHHLTLIRQSIPRSFQFTDSYGYMWYTVRGDHFLSHLQKVYEHAPEVIVFRKKKQKGFFLREFKFGYDLTDATSVDIQKSGKIVERGGKEVDGSEYIHI